MRQWLLGWGLVMMTCMSALASHIMGGYMVLTPSAREGDFWFSLYLLYDDNGSPIDNQVTVSVFKKSDHSRIADFTIRLTEARNVPFANARCATMPLLQTKVAQYSANISLPATTYNDPAGYYIAWEQCCRSGNVVNLVRNTGLVFYAEIPQSSLKNHSPIFADASPKYACRGQRYELNLGALDNDKDELKYSLATPLAGFADASTPSPLRPRSGPYPRARWTAGYDSTRIAGALATIDAKTGRFVLTPTQLGRYAFSVLCEEYRGTQKIGEVRYDFEVLVIDCISEVIPAARAEIKTATPSVTFGALPSGHVNSVQLCTNDSLVLKANDENPQWSYQWQRNGTYITGANQVALSIKQQGDYTLVKKLKQGCNASDSVFATTKVTFKSGASAKITASKRLPLCEGDSVNLSVSVASTTTVNWSFNNTPLNQGGNVLANIKFPGLYQVVISDVITQCSAKDSLIVKVVASPNAMVMAVGSTNFCSNDSTKLITTKQANYDYVWYVNDVPTIGGFGAEYFPSQSGRYDVVVTDTTTGCATRSGTIGIVFRKSPVIVFDSIPSLCGTGVQAVMLSATPRGGTFSGRGVIAGRFVSQNFPAGSYPVTYTYTSAEGCSAKMTRNAVVMPPPKVFYPDFVRVFKGESVEIKTSIPAEATVRWFPSASLDDATSPRPQATPDRTTTYTLTVTTPEGCTVTGEVIVEVIELIVPNGFTPNADGANDTWEISGIDKYPNCTIEVLNRWGMVVFSSKGYQQPWDGTWKNEEVPVGTYYYQIYLREIEYKLTGSLSVIR